MSQRIAACAVILATFAATAALAAETVTYTYDSKGRLVRVDRNVSPGGKLKSSTEYTYDKVHNRTRVQTTLPPP